ncbi:hypothetical protein [Streptomyces albogriseolus]|uniref:hypothetical protein n=1 Tax=Streptomyces albogriseolus TaxID=1887 RepID=UPI003460AA33
MPVPGFTGELTTRHLRAVYRGVDYGACQDECRYYAHWQCQNSPDPHACNAREYWSCMRECTYEPSCYDEKKHDPDGSVWIRTVCRQYDGSLTPQTLWCRNAQKCEDGILFARTECRIDDGTVDATPWTSVDIC